jgi:putative hydrolase of the HAD superfamily
MKRYKTVFFDLDNTLWDFTANSKTAFMKMLTELKTTVYQHSQEEVFQYYSMINSKLWEKYRNNSISKKELVCERFSKTFHHFKLDCPNPAEFNEVYLSILANQTKLVEGATDVLAELEGCGINMHIITNGFREVQYKKLRNTGIDRFFKKVFISEETGFKKPDRKMFVYALKSANARKNESIMVGDEWETDIMGSVNSGIDAVYYNVNSSFLPDNTVYKNTIFHINRLKSIINLLK